MKELAVKEGDTHPQVPPTGGLVRLNLEDAKITIIAIDATTEARVCLQGRGTIVFNKAVSEHPEEQPQPVNDQEASPAPIPEPSKAEAKKKRENVETVKLSGIVARKSDLREMKSGRKVLQVSMAIGKKEDGKTLYHNGIVFYDERAVKANETVHIGQALSITGGRYMRERKTQTGITKQVEEICVFGFGTSRQRSGKSE